MTQSSVPARAADGVKCYGISTAGKNDCAKGTACTAEKGETMLFQGTNPDEKAGLAERGGDRPSTSPSTIAGCSCWPS